MVGDEVARFIESVSKKVGAEDQPGKKQIFHEILEMKQKLEHNSQSSQDQECQKGIITSCYLFILRSELLLFLLL